MKTVKNKMTWKGYPGHTPQGVSMTLPDEVLPLRSILLRFKNGIDTPLGGGMYGDVEDDEHESADYNQVKSLDLVDQQQILEDRIAFIEVIKAKEKEIEEEKKIARQNKPQTVEE